MANSSDQDTLSINCNNNDEVVSLLRRRIRSDSASVSPAAVDSGKESSVETINDAHVVRDVVIKEEGVVEKVEEVKGATQNGSVNEHAFNYVFRPSAPTHRRVKESFEFGCDF